MKNNTRSRALISLLLAVSFLALPITFFLVVVGWVMFRAPDVTTAFGFYRGMLGLNGFGVSDAIAWQLRDFDLMLLAIGVGLVYLEPRLQRFWLEPAATAPSLRRAAFGTAVMVVLSFAAVLKLAADSYSPFLYFQF